MVLLLSQFSLFRPWSFIPVDLNIRYSSASFCMCKNSAVWFETLLKPHPTPSSSTDQCVWYYVAHTNNALPTYLRSTMWNCTQVPTPTPSKMHDVKLYTSTHCYPIWDAWCEVAHKYSLLPYLRCMLWSCTQVPTPAPSEVHAVKLHTTAICQLPCRHVLLWSI